MADAANGDTEPRGPAEQLTSSAPEPTPHRPPRDEPEPTRPPRDSAPVLDVVLDPARPVPNEPPAAPEPPRQAGRDALDRRAAVGGARPSTLSPRLAAVLGTVVGLLIIVNVLAIAAYFDRPTRNRTAANEPASASTVTPGASNAPASAPSPSGSASPTGAASGQGQPSPASSAAGSARPATGEGPWRISMLAQDATVRLLDGTLGRRSFLETAVALGVPRSDAFRIVAALRGLKNLDRPHRHDTFAVALDRDSGRLRAFEYVVSPTEIYQVRATSDGLYAPERVDMHLEEHRQDVAVVVGDDLPTSLRNAGLEPSIVEVLDDALSGRLEMSSLRPGARLRLSATAQTSFGSFAKYLNVSVLEYVAPDDDSGANALRIYHYQGGAEEGYFDTRGRKPFKGAWRSPIPGARVSSGFNLHRMHPVLHVVRPHNGVDFRAAPGTPVYAACRGTVVAVGPSGPSGNLVLIDHGDGFTSGYAHLSRFAPGLHSGQTVETRQLIGYVGSTGRSTGPHLHFSTRKNGTFVDPLRLKLDGEHVLAKSERRAFGELKIALDRQIDAIPLPNVDRAHLAPSNKEGEAEDELDVTDEDAGPGPSP